eukprot:g42536.t1
MVTGYGDKEVQEREGGIRDGPGEFEVGVKGASKVDEMFKLLLGLDVHGEDEVLEAGELKVLEAVEDVGTILNVAGVPGLGGKDGVK